MKNVKRIHILGASGSGTSTLAGKLSEAADYKHLDTDDFYWEDTKPKFQSPRAIEDRIKLMSNEFKKNDKWILSGSLCGWGDILIPYFDLVIFLKLPPEVRLARLKKRERERYGSEIRNGGKRYLKYLEFIEWASNYDEGDTSIRSLKRHNIWLREIKCDVLRIEEDIVLDEKVKRVFEKIKAIEINDNQGS